MSVMLGLAEEIHEVRLSLGEEHPAQIRLWRMAGEAAAMVHRMCEAERGLRQESAILEEILDHLVEEPMHDRYCLNGEDVHLLSEPTRSRIAASRL